MYGIKSNPSKSLFFDRKAVIQRVDASRLKALREIGGYVRRVARNSIKSKPSGTTSPPGSPPYSHVGAYKTTTKRGKEVTRFRRGLKGADAGLKNIRFSYDPVTQSVIIGPVLLHGRSGWAGKTVPELLETGGTAVSTQRRRKKRTARFSLRPFMGPAGAVGQDRFPRLFKGTV